MCQICTDLVNKHFPDKTDEEKYFIAWNLTAYPAIDPTTEDGRALFEQQLDDARLVIEGKLEPVTMEEIAHRNNLEMAKSVVNIVNNRG